MLENLAWERLGALPEDLGGDKEVWASPLKLLLLQTKRKMMDGGWIQNLKKLQILKFIFLSCDIDPSLIKTTALKKFLMKFGSSYRYTTLILHFMCSTDVYQENVEVAVRWCVLQREETAAHVLLSRVSVPGGKTELFILSVELLQIVSWRPAAHQTARPN